MMKMAIPIVLLLTGSALADGNPCDLRQLHPPAECGERPATFINPFSIAPGQHGVPAAAIPTNRVNAPEPSSLAVLSVALGGLVAAIRRRRRS